MGSLEKKKQRNPKLLDFVFSWSIDDIMNNNHYRNKVDQIEETFSSLNHYLSSFMMPLIEEMHADLRSNMTSLHSAPVAQILRVEEHDDFEPPKKLLYNQEQRCELERKLSGQESCVPHHLKEVSSTYILPFLAYLEQLIILAFLDNL